MARRFVLIVIRERRSDGIRRGKYVMQIWRLRREGSEKSRRGSTVRRNSDDTGTVRSHTYVRGKTKPLLNEVVFYPFVGCNSVEFFGHLQLDVRGWRKRGWVLLLGNGVRPSSLGVKIWGSHRNEDVTVERGREQASLKELQIRNGR